MNAEELAGIPAIDVRTIPPFERHARIFSILEALKPHQSHSSLGYKSPAPEAIMWPAAQPGPASPATPAVAPRPVMH